MKKALIVWMTALLVSGCGETTGNQQAYLLQGAWVLRQMDYPIGGCRTYSETEGTSLRLYDGDSVMYECNLTRTASGLMVTPNIQSQVTLIDKGHSEYLYLEEDDPHPLTIVDDSTIVIQRNGILFTWVKVDDIEKEWGSEMKDIIAADAWNNKEGERQRYMLSAKERQQANMIHGFIFSTIGIILILVLMARVAIDNRKQRCRLQLQLQQIQEVKEERPLSVKQAIESVETTYFSSDEYQTLQRRIATGQRLKDDDWSDIENQIKKVYPGFSSQLRGLYTLSELEYQVCLLIKLRIAPSDIAAILARDASTISTVRSRLYQKVFGKKGGTKEWDDFILSIGT